MHQWCLGGWGVMIGEMWDLERLCDRAEALGRWTCFVSSVPLKVGHYTCLYPTVLTLDPLPFFSNVSFTLNPVPSSLSLLMKCLGKKAHRSSSNLCDLKTSSFVAYTSSHTNTLTRFQGAWRAHPMQSQFSRPRYRYKRRIRHLYYIYIASIEVDLLIALGLAGPNYPDRTTDLTTSIPNCQGIIKFLSTPIIRRSLACFPFRCGTLYRDNL